jgi:hypothetical protein
MKILDRYQTGPVATLVVFVVLATLVVSDIFDAIHSHSHAWQHWMDAVTGILLLFLFHKKFSRSTEELTHG